MHDTDLGSTSYLPDQVFSSDHACGNSIAEGVELDCLMCLQVFLSKEYIEIGVLLDRYINLVGIFGTKSWVSGRGSFLLNHSWTS
jgi:hypothetical protein